MSRKQERHEAIRQLIRAGNVRSQEELLFLLHDRGFDGTQATLSRDLHELKVIKVPDGDKGSAYRIEGPGSVSGEEQYRINYLADGFLDLQVSGNLAVIRTKPGYASSIAVVIDNARHTELLGTIAGDDTILLIIRENVTKNELVELLVKTFPYLKNKISV